MNRVSGVALHQSITPYFQGNLSPEEAAEGYKKQQMMVGPQTLLGSPSASACKEANKKCMMSDYDW